MMNRKNAVDEARGNTSTGADAASGPVERFLALVREAIDTCTLQRLVLSRPARKMLPPGFVDEGPVLQRVRIRPVRLRGGVKLAFGWQYDTRDQTDNLPLDEAQVRIAGLLGDMRSALLETSVLTAELGFGKRGTPLFRMKRHVAAGGAGDGRENWQQGTGALTQLRRASRAGHLTSGDDVPMDTRPGHVRSLTAEDDGWGALDTQNRQRTALCGQVGGAGQQPLRIRDYGAGKGYLTFALHDHLTHQLGLQVETVGVERRADLVALCNRLAQKNGMAGLRFEKGDILRAGDAPQGLQEGQEGLQGLREDVHVIIALHACDTATDDALWQGIRQQAAMLVCSPCCHRELRPQLQAPAPLTALLRHGIHLGLEAEMLTDGLRALLLETQGYEAQVFEFISPDDTGKNRMILGCRTGRARPAAEARAEIDALKAFYGIRHQRLDALLQASDGLSPS